jgi:hypothetical protein
MSSAALDRRLRKLETATGSEDIRHYLHRPLVEWPDHILQLGIEMGHEELAKLIADLPDWSGCESQQPADPDENVWKRRIEADRGRTREARTWRVRS